MSASHIPAAPRRRGPFLSTLAAAAAALAVTLGAPQSAGAQTVFHACYVPASGTVYRIKAPSTPQNCLQPTHVAFSWTDGADAAAALQEAVKSTDVAGGDVTGVFSNLSVRKLLGRTLATTPPTDGQVLSWNAAAQQWEAKTVSVSGGGVSGVTDHGALTGLADDDHVAYLRAGAVRVTGSFAVNSPLGSTSPALVHTGSTWGGFVAIPSKGAIRAGITSDATQWTDNKIGRASASFGEANIASGDRSFAAGYEARAEGSMSTAMGWKVTASGFASFAVGQNSVASGQNSFAFGNASVASGTNSAAFGGLAAGTSSFAIGYGKAEALNSVAFSGHSDSQNGMAFGHRAHTNGKPNSVVFATGDPNNGLIRPATNGQFVVSAPHIFLGHVSQPYANPDRFIETGTGAYLTSGGNWSNSSDSTKKSDFRAVDGEQVLSKLAALPVYTWRYLAEDSTIRHMGPTSQAFRKAFGLGDTDKAIGTVDIDGVAVAGVKALEARTKQLKAETQALRAENAQLAERLAQLESLVARLTPTSKER